MQRLQCDEIEYFPHIRVCGGIGIHTTLKMWRLYRKSSNLFRPTRWEGSLNGKTTVSKTVVKGSTPLPPAKCLVSSIGRASRLHREGYGFKSYAGHH